MSSKKANILTVSRFIYNGLYDENGKQLSKPVGNLARLGLPQNNIKFLKQYMQFLMESSVLNKYSKIYVSSPIGATKAVFEKYRKTVDPSLNVKTAISGIDYNRKKLEAALFDGDILNEFLDDSEPEKLDEYYKLLEQAMAKFMGDGPFDKNIVIRVPKNVSYEKPDDSVITELFTILSQYKRENIKKVETMLSSTYSGAVGYLNYLYKKTDKNEEEEMLYEELIAFIQ